MKIEELVNVCNGTINKNENLDKKINKIKIDSRQINKGDVFIALKGDKNDGHDYIIDVIKKRPAAIIVERNIPIKSKIPIIKVADTYECLLKLATYIRQSSNIPLIAITGSAGKTTTKELISQILSKRYNVLKSIGSHNNHIGVPLTLFDLNESHEIIVMELGMNHIGEINTLSKICMPDTAVITNIGTSHIGNLGDMKTIFKAKTEILNYINNGTLVLNGDDKYLKKLKNTNHYKVIKAGMNLDNNIIAHNIKTFFYKTLFDINIGDEQYQITFNVPGKHLINNVLLAIKIGLEYGVDIIDIIDAIAKYEAVDKRMNVIKLNNNNILIDDCYNSSYESLIGAIELIKNEPFNKILIIGDILELGKFSKTIHKKLKKHLETLTNTKIIFIGEATKEIANIGLYFNSNEKVIEYLTSQKFENTIFLVKGSRKLALEKISDFIKKDSET